MILSRDKALPRLEVPAGFQLRGYRPGDVEVWFRILSRADRYLPVTIEQHGRSFGGSEPELSRRQLFLLAPDGTPIGTSTAWFGSNPLDATWGRVHWLAVLPEWQGRGLGKALLAATLRRLQELGHSRIYLITETVRRRAIALYLEFGFTPDLRTERERHDWRQVIGDPPSP